MKQLANYMDENPQMIVSGFVKAGISPFLSADEDDTIDIQESNRDETYVEVDSDSEEFVSDQTDDCASAEE